VVDAADLVERLQLGDHVCAFIDGRDDGLELIARTVAAGLADGDKVMVFTESLLPAAVFAGLRARGVPVERVGQAGQVRLLAARNAYLPDGWFDPRRMLDSLVEEIDRAVAEGYRGLRLVGDMVWALDETAGVEQLAWYEAQVNRVYMQGRALGLCLYDRRAFGSQLLQEVACAHPAVTGVGAGTGEVPLLRIRRSSDPYGLRLTGEADLSNRQAVAAALEGLLAEQPDPDEPIVVDVAGLRFADVATVALLAGLALRVPAGVQLTGCHGAVSLVADRLGVARIPGIRLTPSGVTERLG
jgi:hypothetical protein